ncbi:Lipase (class 3) [Posidoniimonas corsicana]|uniref:Lipase (Class 3) n=1 Tax=Posidoniimonas corsicana TaxID=1938618 RepID=A0A5C5V2Z8_9BACT|nr:lipase family protein [Posidoniimonas corsicana]TWT32319.1 Lipase (class 3) [Posidoniimonas corsicana]
MFDWFLTYFELILGIAGAVSLIGIAMGFLRITLTRPSRSRWRVLGGIALLSLVCFLAVLRGGPGGKKTTPQELDPDRLIDTSLTAVERLQNPWEAYEDPRWPVVETLAEISDIAYDPPVFAAGRYEGLGLSRCFPLFDRSMVGYVLAIDDVAVVVFRGTDFNEWSDWGVNKAVRAAPTEHGGIHAGFDRAYDGLSPQINEVLDRLAPKHLWVTGHSLGGALATVCAYRLESRGEHKVTGLITFGQPMVAKLDLAEHLDDLFDNRYAWFVNGSDVVPKTPPGYEPAGSLVELNGTLRPGRWRRTRAVYSSSSVDDSLPAQPLQAHPLPPLTEEESRLLQQRLKAEPPPVFDDAPRAYSMAVPEIDNHLMPAYLGSIRQLLGISMRGD